MFVQIIRGRAKDPGGLRKQIERWNTELKPGAKGFLGSTGGVAEDGEFVGVVRFASEADARRNSERKEQGAWWAETEKLLEPGVRFLESTDVEIHHGGGSDDAGFVQVMEGRVTDRARAQEIGKQFDAVITKERPDVIGSTTIWRGSEFTDVVYFSSEKEARAGEKKELSPALQTLFQQWQSVTPELRFIDLREPWFASA